jgi:glycerophosphoryl diester phosphodiesterase
VATALDWLAARPIAHRGLHDAAGNVIENTAAAVRAAIDGTYGIEVDLQISADGEAMVHHDDVLGRFTEGEGRLDQLSAAALKRVPFRDSAERMLTLGELCDLVGGRATILLELKSRFDGDSRLPARVAAVLAGYNGPVAPMSFDPMQLNVLRHKAPCLPRGIVAAKYRPHPYWDRMPPWLRYGMGSLLPSLTARPFFVAYAVGDLPAAAPLLARHILCLPLLAWVVRTQIERQRAARHADQMIFEGFRP